MSIYTRAATGATFSLLNADSKSTFVENVEVKHDGSNSDEEKPTIVILNPSNLIKGPLKLKVKADSKGSRFSSYEYLLVFAFKPAK